MLASCVLPSSSVTQVEDTIESSPKPNAKKCERAQQLLHNHFHAGTGFVDTQTND
jgi:hypothetical protein